MKVADFARDMTQAPSSEDRVTIRVNGQDFEVTAVEFLDGQVVLSADTSKPGTDPVALAEQTAQDQQAFQEEGAGVPGHADVMNQISTGEGIASDLRAGDVKTEPEKSDQWKDRGQEYHAGPEQPSVPVQDEQVAEDSGT